MTPFQGKLRIRHLEIVLLVAEHGNLSKAARHLHMTQSGLSRAMAEMEEAVGGRLFERSAKGMRATALGVAVCRHANVLLGDFRKAETDLAAIARGELGSITIGCFSLFSGWPLVDAVAAFRRAHPKVELSVDIGTHERLVEVLDTGALDVLISRTPATLNRDTYRIVPLINDPVVLTCAPDHPLASSDAPTWAECAVYPWISALPSARIRVELMGRLSEANVQPPDIVGALSLEFGRDMLSAGPYLLMLPGSVAHMQERRGMLHVLPVDLKLRRSPLAAMWRRDRPSTRQTRAFVSMLAGVIKDAQL
ncbi:LysR family transcriptional regulator [Pigmentiphaga litoralis]|uniref:LysR family transcriptional regulator n=1 Tax=Pigmentiphaga litoralis TaxID=516702 RepID=UPI003B4336CF